MSDKKVKQKRVIGVLTGDQRKKHGQLFALWNKEDRAAFEQLKKALAEIPKYTFSFLDNHDDFPDRLQTIKGEVDFVLNLCDDGFKNDSGMELHIPALFETHSILYTGGDPRCLAICNDKSLVRGAAREMGIPIPQGMLIRSPEELRMPSFGFPAIVKPNFGDGGEGITKKSVVTNMKELRRAFTGIFNMRARRNSVLVEEFLDGKDLSIAIIGNPPGRIPFFAIAEKDYSTLDGGLPKIWGYEGKWERESPYYNLQSALAKIPRATETFLRQANTLLFERLGCRDYARFDWRFDAKGLPRLLEVNPNPCWWYDGYLAKTAAMKSMSYSAMIRAILTSAEKRLNI